MPVFHEDQLLEILSRLPGKNLCQLSLVSKSINELLSDDFFIKKQSENMRRMGDSDFLLQHKSFSSYGYDRLELHPIRREGDHNSCSLPVEVVESLGKILASFNGLLCCGRVGENPLFLLNPTTRSCMQVPIPDESLIGAQLRFGLILDRAAAEDESTGDYSLLSVVIPQEWGANQFRCRIFSPSEKIWKDFDRIDFGGRNIMLESSIQLKGVLYFVSDGGIYFEKGSEFFWPYVVSYDMKTRTTKFWRIPKRARKGSCHSNLAIYKWGSGGDTDTICLVGLWRNKFSVWILCPNTDTNGLYWRSAFRMRIKAMGLGEIDRTKVSGYSVVNGRTWIFATEEKVYAYDLSDGTNGKIEELCKHGFDGADVCFHPFCGTLRRCGPDAGKNSMFELHCDKKYKVLKCEKRPL